MIDHLTDASDPARNERRQRIARLYVRGLSLRQMSRRLQVAESILGEDVAAVREEWTSAWGAVEIGECTATYRAIEEMCSHHAHRLGLSAHARCQVTQLALSAADRESALGARLRRRHPSGVRHVTVESMRQYHEAVRRALAEAAPTRPADIEHYDRRREIERLLARRRPETDLAHALHVPLATVRDDVVALHNQWTATFGTVEAGETIARYRDCAEQMLNAAVQPSRSGQDQRQFLQSAMRARDRQIALLAQLGRLDAAREACQAPQPTPEELEDIRATWDEPLFNLDDPFIRWLMTDPGPEAPADVRAKHDELLALRKGSIWSKPMV